MTKGPQLLVSRVPAVLATPSQQYVIVVWGMNNFLVTDLVLLLMLMERISTHSRSAFHCNIKTVGDSPCPLHSLFSLLSKCCDFLGDQCWLVGFLRLLFPVPIYFYQKRLDFLLENWLCESVLTVMHRFEKVQVRVTSSHLDIWTFPVNHNPTWLRNLDDWLYRWFSRSLLSLSQWPVESSTYANRHYAILIEVGCKAKFLCSSSRSHWLGILIEIDRQINKHYTFSHQNPSTRWIRLVAARIMKNKIFVVKLYSPPAARVDLLVLRCIIKTKHILHIWYCCLLVILTG